MKSVYSDVARLNCMMDLFEACKVEREFGLLWNSIHWISPGSDSEKINFPSNDRAYEA